MSKNWKSIIEQHKKGIVIGSVVGSLVIGGGLYALTYGSEGAESVLSDDEQVAAVTEFETRVFDEPTTYAEATEAFETLMPKLNNENQVQVLDMYLFELDSQLNQLSGMLPIIQEDLKMYDEDVETLVSESFIDELPNTMVKGFLSEIHDSYFVLSKEDSDTYTVKTDYTGFKETYAESLSEDMANYITLAEHANAHDYYDSVAGHALFSALKDRLDLTRSLMGGDERPDESQLLAEEYMVYQALLGVADIGMNTEDGEYNQDAIDAMQEVIDGSDDEVLNQDMTTIMTSMTAEGSYGSATEEKALSIIEERFSHLLVSSDSGSEVSEETKGDE